MRNYYRALAADAVLVVLFSVLGTLSHNGALTLVNLARVAWPFLAGLVLAHLVLRAWRVEPWRLWPHGVFIVAITVVTAMLLRTLTGAGTALPFVLVSFAVNALFLLGWRVIAGLVTRRKQADVGHSSTH